MVENRKRNRRKKKKLQWSPEVESEKIAAEAKNDEPQGTQLPDPVDPLASSQSQERDSIEEVP